MKVDLTVFRARAKDAFLLRQQNTQIRAGDTERRPQRLRLSAARGACRLDRCGRLAAEDERHLF